MKNQKSTTLPQLTALIAGAVIVVSGIVAPMVSVRADQYEEQIKALEKLKEQNQSEANALGEQADKKETEIEKLQNQISGIQAQIEVNQARQEKLEKEIKAAQKRLEEQKVLLSANIRSMYIEGDISPLEMLASSKNISDFVDKQEYRDRIKENITNTLDEIEKLKQKLDEQKQEVVKIIEEQKTKRGVLADKRAEANNKLASLNLSKAEFEEKVEAQSERISQLRAEQLAANRAAFGGGGQVINSGDGGGGYPYNNVGYPCWGGSGCVDPWGLYKRECVSYTAWKVYQNKGSMPYFGGRGNANEWPSTAQSMGISTGSTAKRHSVAISYAGPFGHAMWVEDVLPNGQIHVSEYNFNVDGRYTERIISSSGLVFIYF